jgi:UDP-N-acetylglucosamine 1-carboxyvinyltransferase
VGATENALLAAFMAKGKTILKNCAIEPEIIDLISFLKKLGGKIKVSGRTATIYESKIKNNLITHEVIFDRIETGTYMIASALIGRKVTIKKIDPSKIKSEINILKKMGIKIKKNINSITLQKSANLKKINVTTRPYPGFPTDLQAQLMVLMTQAKGMSKISENIFENRFMHVPELKRMGAKINIKKKTALIEGPTKLTGAEVMATDLRASVSLVLAGLIAENRTLINRIYHLDRGYELLETKLRQCNAEIKRV